MAGRTVSVRLLLELAGVDKVKAGSEQVKKLGDEIKGAKKDNLDKISTAAGVAGGALLAMAGYGIKAAADFDKAMSDVQAATHASAGTMHDLRAAALQAGKDTSYSATEAAHGIEELSKAGVGAADVLHGGLSGALSLAAAGGLDVAEAAETSASALTQFKLAGSEVPHVADLLAAGAGKAQGSVHDMGQALNQSGLVASQFGMSIEETTGTLAAFASAGLIGSDAGTSLKTMLIALANPAKQTQQLMDDLGISAYDAQGNFIGVARLAQVLKDKLGVLSAAERQQALAQIFGNDAIRAGSILFEQGADGIQKWIDKTNDAGFAAETARIKTDNLSGDVERLKGSVETLAITSGSGANGGLRILTQTVGALVDQFGDLPPVVGSSLTILAGAAGVGALGIAGWLRLRGSVREALDALRDVGPTGAKAATHLQTVGKWAGRAGAAFTTLQIVSAVADAMGDGAPNVEAMAGALKKLATNGEKAGEVTRTFGGDMGRFRDDVKFLQNLGGLKNAGNAANLENLFGLGGMSFSVNKRLEDIRALDSALAQLASGGHLQEANDAFEQFAKQANAAGISTSQLRDLLPQYSDAAREAGTAMLAGGMGAGDMSSKTKDLSSSLNDAANSGAKLKDQILALNNTAVGWAQAQIGVEGAIDNVTESIKAHGRSLDLDTEAGRSNVSMVIDATQKAADAAQSRYETTKATDGEAKAVQNARDTYSGYIKKLEDTLVKAGMTRDQAHKLVQEYGKMPPAVSTTVTAPGLSKTLGDVQDLYGYLYSLNGKTFTSHVRVVASRATGPIASANRMGGVYEHAQVGLLREAQVYSATNPGRYMIAEPGTRGEAFIPKSGDYGRSMAILSRAAGWYGARVVPGGGSAGPGLDSRALAAALAGALSGVAVVMDGRVVGRIQARQADLLARGG